MVATGVETTIFQSAQPDRTQGTPTPVFYQWQVLSGTNRLNIPHATGSVLTIPRTTPAMDNQKVRVLTHCTSNVCDVESNEAVLHLVYPLVYEPNTGTGTMARETYAGNTTFSLTANTFTKTGYVFDGWNTEKDGSGTGYTNMDTYITPFT